LGKPLVESDPYLYIVESSIGITEGNISPAIKVGCSINPKQRLISIASQEKLSTSFLSLRGWQRVKRSNALSAERFTHWQLRDCHIRGEWFNASPDMACAAINRTMKAIDQMGELPVFPSLSQNRLITPAAAAAQVHKWASQNEAVRQLLESALKGQTEAEIAI
jgi:hypothetical protein